MSKTNRLNEKARAERLAHDLDYRMPNQAYTEQTTPEDRPLLVLAEKLSGQNPLGATNMERTQLWKTFEQAKATKTRQWKPLPLFRLLKPTAQMTLWAVLLVGIFAITMVLVSNLVGKPSHPISGPAQTTPAPIATLQSTAETPQVPKPVTMNLEQALALVQYPTWGTVFFEYQVAWHGADGKDYSFYKQVWMDREGRGHVLSSDQVEGVSLRSPEVKPILLFISDGTDLKALHLPGGQEEPGFANSPWLVTPLENAGQNMADFFPTINGLGKVGTLTLEGVESEAAGRPALLMYGSEDDYWFDRDTGLLLRKFHRADGMEIIVRAVAFDVELPKAWDEVAGVEQIAFLDTLPTKTAESLPTPRVTFTTQNQTVNGIPLELRDLVIIGTSPRATLCYTAPGEGSWRLEGVTVQAGGPPSTFYPSSSAQPQPDANGLICETFTAAYPLTTGTGAREWKLTVQRLVGPRQTTPVCEAMAKQITNDHPGLVIECRSSSGMPSYTLGEPPPGMRLYEASLLIRTYFEADVRSGPWTFTINPREVTFLQYTISPTNLVVVPAACDTMSNLLADRQFAPALDHAPNPPGIAGGGTLHSGNFTFLMGLACDPNFSRMRTYSDERSFINGLGVLLDIRYDGPPTGDGVEYFTGIWPFVMHQGGGGSLGSGESFFGYEGLLLPDTIQPDLTQSDVRLRYLARVRLPDGSIDGAALVFTLQRAFEGYRPVDVIVEPLAEAEKQTAELTTTPTEPLPFPTLMVPEKSVSAQNQTVLDLLDRWQKPLLALPGWIYMRTRVDMPGGNDLFAGLTAYTNDDWFQTDEQGLIVTHIHIDARLDGTVLQQSYSHNGQSVNLTFGSLTGTDVYKPTPLDLAYSVKGALKSPGAQVAHTSVDGLPILLVTVPAGTTWREAVDATSGAWLYSEHVDLQESDNPLTGGTLNSRTTVETVERVSAPAAHALALLGQEFTGYRPPSPYGTPAPQGFDPSGSKITLQSVHGDDFFHTTFWYGDLYVDNYLLGRVDFGSVPGGFCERSADGSKLAFNHLKTDPSSSLSSSSLRWVDLRSIQTIHQPAPELVNLGILSWSTKRDTLAVFGCKAEQKDCGFYLLDPATGQVRLLQPDVYASWQPIWSPDGSQIAFVNTLKEGHTMYVVDIQTGQVIYQGEFDADDWQVPADSPTIAWGVTFSRDASGSRCFEMK